MKIASEVQGLDAFATPLNLILDLPELEAYQGREELLARLHAAVELDKRMGQEY